MDVAEEIVVSAHGSMGGIDRELDAFRVGLGLCY